MFRNWTFRVLNYRENYKLYMEKIFSLNNRPSYFIQENDFGCRKNVNIKICKLQIQREIYELYC